MELPMIPRVSMLLLLILASQPNAQVVRHGQLGPAQRAHVQSLGAAAARLVIDTPRGGHVAQKVLGALPLSAGTLQQRCDELIARHGVLFGATDAMEFGAPLILREQSAAPAGQSLNVHLPQLVHSFPLEGHGLWLRFDAQGQLACVHGVLSAAAAVLPAPVVSPQEAEAAALARLAALGHALADFRSGPSTQTLARLVNGAPTLLHETRVVLKQGLAPLAVTVDAASGAVLGVRENKSSGTGNFHFDGQNIPFTTGNGTGTAYTSLKKALASAPAITAMKEVGFEDVVLGLAENNVLFGRFAQMFGELDADNIFSFLAGGGHNWAVSTDDEFTFGDPTSDAQLFDLTNSYLWISRMGHYMEGPFGKPIATDYSLPVVVNVEIDPFDPVNGAFTSTFYTNSDLGVEAGPGFIVFENWDDVTHDSMDDTSRDPTALCHEYVHAVVDQTGFVFGDADTDTPPRAVNEAVADFFSGAFNKTPCIGVGVVTFMIKTDSGCLRDLAEPRLFPDDLFDFVGQTGLPEEHEAGVIFGATEWRYGQALKNPGAARMADSMFDWPQTNAEVGFPVVNVGNAEDAYGAFMGACVTAMVDAVAFGPGSGIPATKAGKVLGAVIANGLSGSAVEGNVYPLDLLAGGKVKVSSVFLPPRVTHDFEIVAAAGQIIALSLKGSNGTKADFTLGEGDGDLDFPQGKVVNAAGTSAKQSGIAVLTGGTFPLEVTNPGALGGAYKLTITLK
jgi:hypothetical protein